MTATVRPIISMVLFERNTKPPGRSIYQNYLDNAMIAGYDRIISNISKIIILD